MTPPLLDLNVSQVIAFQRSELDWYFQYVKKRVRRQSLAYLHVGTWWHSLMEHYFTILRLDPLNPALARARAETFGIDERMLLARTLNQSISVSDFLQQSGHLLTAFTSFELRYPPTSIFSIEEPLRVQLPDSDHFLIGIPDTVILFDDLHWHLQHKTMSSRTPVANYIATTQRVLHELAYAYLICFDRSISPTDYGGCYLNIARKLTTTNSSPFIQELIPISWHQVSSAIRDISAIAARMSLIISGSATPIDSRETDLGAFGTTVSPYFGVKTGAESLDDDLLFEDFVSRYDQRPSITSTPESS